ncbi:MAG TPA: alpha/beta hydrolase [Xanthobacteraceae bacterium]|nr:alpha/beta hydrolase [Xanthobacteraceae bacterium]
MDQETRDPRLYAPLAAFGGKEPPAPLWFNRAIEEKPERSFVEVAGAKIETLAWGERGKPGILFMHGNGAHADWWSFIAPFFSAHWRVAALSWSGMGGSDWRKHYTLENFVNEALTVAETTGLFAAAEKPVFVGHSFGGVPTIAAGMMHGERLRAAIIVDTPLWSPEERKARRERRKAKGGEPRPNRIYPGFNAALARFRLAPIQGCENVFIADFIARHSLKEVDGAGGKGWTWKFDPFMWHQFELPDLALELAAIKCPVALMWGSHSKLMSGKLLDYALKMAPAGTPKIEIPDAEHHVMIDQPLAFVAALRGLLAGWPR